ncbi:MAG: MFS transporter [Chloroflexi bacterium]|nr:MFS transporter [Chloroflexota bacterium]
MHRNKLGGFFLTFGWEEIHRVYFSKYEMNFSDQRAVLRVTAALMLAQSLSSAAYSSSVAVNQLAIVGMTGLRSLGGLPSAVVLAGSAFMAYQAGKLVTRFGRRYVLTLGTLFGVLGGAIAGTGVFIASIAIFLCGLVVIGFGRGILDQSRFAAAEVNPSSRRARALSFVVWGATIGAVGGPLIAPPLDALGQRLGLPQYVGALYGTASFYVLAGVAIFVLLALDLRGLVTRVAALEPAVESETAAAKLPDAPQRSLRRLLGEVPAARTALVAMAAGQASMALMMSCISIHMKDHNHGLGDIAAVISMHTLGMYALSPVVGLLTDRIGRRRVIMLGASILIIGCVLVPISLNTPVIALAEFLVGLGWSGCYVAGSTLLTDALGKDERARLQGANDSVISICSAVGSLSSGILLELIGIWPLSFVGLAVSALPLVFAAKLAADRRSLAMGSA